MTGVDPASLLESLLRRCTELGASDVHVASGHRPRLRVQGPLEPMDGWEPIDAATVEAMARRVVPDVDDRLASRGSLDGALASEAGGRFRINIFRTAEGVALAIRRLEDRFRTLDELGLPPALGRLADLPDGLVIVSGPTGSGKSTTLATLIDRVNQSHDRHVITIEDPIEYVHRSRRSLVSQRQVGRDAGGFYEALVASLRQDPDVILVGEIRDLDTIRTAIIAAETGHLVLTTVHAGDCVGTIERLVGVFPADEQDGVRRQLSMTLRCVINQQLLVSDGPALAADREAGRRRRVLISEVLTVTPAVSNLIVKARSAQIYSAMESGGGLGMQTREQDLARRWRAGLLTERSAIGASRRPDLVRDRMAMLGEPVAPASGGRS